MGGPPAQVDYFISYTFTDRAWAEWIAWQLKEDGSSVVLQAWDMIPGMDFIHEMEKATATAKRMLAVWSPAYFTSPFAEAEWRASFADDPTGEQRRLIPVRVADFTPPKLLRTRIYIDLVGKDRQAARAALLEGVKAQPATVPTEEPAFPGEQPAALEVFEPSPEEPRLPASLGPIVGRPPPPLPKEWESMSTTIEGPRPSLVRIVLPAELPLTDDDRRVLETVVQHWDRHMTFPSNRWISAGTGIPPIGVGEAMQRLSEADPPYLNKRQGVTERGRLALMQGHNRADVGSRPIRLFYSYSHKDEKLREQLEVRLRILNRQGLIEEWHDRKIPPGREWKNDIDSHLEDADVILLLVSPDFLGSDYAHEEELRRALERHRSREALVVPIILRHSDWRETPIRDLQALPTDGKPVVDGGDRAWQEVTQGLRQVIEELYKAH